MRDVLVVGRPSQRWGSEVVAVIELVGDSNGVGDDSLSAHVRGVLAAYKVPRAFIRVPQVMRGPAGKADYRWAKAIAEQASEPP